MTSSARTTSDYGIVRPRAMAALALIVSIPQALYGVMRMGRKLRRDTLSMSIGPLKEVMPEFPSAIGVRCRA